MLSMSHSMNAGQAGNYFSKEDYYLRDAELGQNSRWCGEGARALGLDGPVCEEDFRSLCRGEDPGGKRIVSYKLTHDQETGAVVETRRAGNDCTFSAPKSVSIAYVAGVDSIKDAHDAAVVTVAAHLERHNCFYRSSQGLQHASLVAAKFDHATSRNIDPQLHSHLFVLNAVQNPNGNWRANEPKGIYQDLKALGFLYRVELARELEARGFQIAIKDRSQMFFELQGVDPQLVQHFSSRRQEIENQVDAWKAEGKFAEVSAGRLFEMAALETRDPKREITREEVARIFEKGFEACGTSSVEVKRELESSLAPALKEPKRLPGETPAQVVELAARDLTERQAVMERTRLLDQAARISGMRHGLRELDAAIDAGPQGVLRLGCNSRGREFYTTRAMKELEAGNLAKVRELAGSQFRGAAHEHEIEAFRDRLASEGTRLTAGQWQEFGNEVAGKSAFTLTVGDPGTAKTGTLAFVERFNHEVLEPTGRKPTTIDLAYTGKAARQMSLATGRPSHTVDSFLNAAAKFDLQREKRDQPILEVTGEKYVICQEVPVVLRVDEAGLLGAKRAHELLQVVEELRERGTQVKLHLLGDTKQLQAISAGDFLRQVEALGTRGEVEFAHLTEILRQRDPEMLEIARGLNREDRALDENAREGVAALQKVGALTEISSEQELISAAVKYYLEQSGKPSQLPERALAGERQSVLMMTGTTAERTELNREVREARIAAGEIEEGKSYSVLAPVQQGITVEGYRTGDTLLFPGVRGEDATLRNWGARIGTEAEVTGIDRERNLVQVRYSFQGKQAEQVVERTVNKNFSAAELAGRTALYREEERRFSVGDRIVALKNDRALNLQNGDLATIKELDQRGRAVVDLGDRRVELDLAKYRQIDHAYAVTIHKSQGSTVEHSIMVARVRPETEHGKDRQSAASSVPESYGHLSYNSFNVAVTRAQFGTHVFTNSIEGFSKAVQVVDTNTSSLDKEEKRKVEVEGAGHGLPQSSGELAVKIRELGRTVPLPGDGVHRLTVKSISVPSLPARELFKPVAVTPTMHKEVARQLELALPKKLGLERERGR